ncbi:MAG: hypothetical protein ACWA5R_13595 [bacterium]
MIKTEQLIILALLIPALFLAQPSAEETAHTLQKMKSLWQFSKTAAREFDSNKGFGGSMESIIKAYQDSLRKLCC